MLHMPTAVLLNAGTKTYVEFLAHIAALAVDGSITFSSASAPGSGRYRSTAATPAGDMSGSSWADGWRTGVSDLSRVIQHGMPNDTVFFAVISQGRQVYFETAPGTNLSVFNSANRNSYISLSRNLGGGPETTGYLVDLIYWDSSKPVGQEPQRMNPAAGTGPTLYTW